jgi:hypothetical protein
MNTMSHDQARQWIEQAADGIQGAEQQAALQAHLATCATCQAYGAELANLESALSEALQAHWPGAGMSADAVDRLVQEVQSQPGGGSGGSSGGWFRTPPTILLSLLAFLLLAWFGYSGFFGATEAEATATPTKQGSGLGVGTATPSPSPSPSPTITITPSPTDLVLIAVPVQNVNCREGAGSSQFEIADTLYEGEEYTPLARGFDNLWVQFRGPFTERLCWVYVQNLEMLINNQVVAIEDISEALLPYAPYPPTPTPSLTPTFTPQPSQTPTPTCTPRPNFTGGPKTC